MSIIIQGLSAWYGRNQALFDIDLTIPANQVTALIGPSGCGKSTFVRCLNRMHETIPDARASGQVLVGGYDIYAQDVRPLAVRRQIGMVFQQPNVLPSRSIYDNVAIGLQLNGLATSETLADRVERSLRAAALWEEVKDRLRSSAQGLSGGQQQRLCIARAVAIEPLVLLMDEPASALDPIATLQIEDLMKTLRERYTIIVVTHNMQQAARVADRTAFFLSGHLVEQGETGTLFSHPTRQETEDYITGRFG